MFVKQRLKKYFYEKALLIQTETRELYVEKHYYSFFTYLHSNLTNEITYHKNKGWYIYIIE